MNHHEHNSASMILQEIKSSEFVSHMMSFVLAASEQYFMMIPVLISKLATACLTVTRLNMILKLFVAEAWKKMKLAIMDQPRFILVKMSL